MICAAGLEAGRHTRHDVDTLPVIASCGLTYVSRITSPLKLTIETRANASRFVDGPTPTISQSIATIDVSGTSLLTRFQKPIHRNSQPAVSEPWRRVNRFRRRFNNTRCTGSVDDTGWCCDRIGGLPDSSRRGGVRDPGCALLSRLLDGFPDSGPVGSQLHSCHGETWLATAHALLLRGLRDRFPQLPWTALPPQNSDGLEH